MAKPLAVVWTKHLRTQDQKQTFEQTLRASSTIVGRLKEILDEEERALDAQTTGVAEFDNPSWAYKQAYRLGEKNRIRKLRELIDFI